VLPRKPEKAHPTKGEDRQEIEPIFAEFANCDTYDKFLYFANKYGRLTNNRVGLPSEKKPHSFDSVAGEPVQLWEDETLRMKTALSFWQADAEYIRNNILFIDDENKNFHEIRYNMCNNIKEPLLAASDDLIDHMANHMAYLCAPHFQHVLASSRDTLTSHLLKYLPSGDHEAAAKMIASVITSTAMYHNPAKSNLHLNADGSVDMRIMPDNLLAFIWYSFAETIARQRTVRQCIECKGFIEVADESSRMVFHEACRNRIKMRRSRCKEKYTAMLQAGIPLKDIAAACKVNLDILKYWIDLDEAQGTGPKQKPSD
jgi:hypothetical protein